MEEKKGSKLNWKDVESAIDNLNEGDLKIWVSDLLYLPEELDKAREEGITEIYNFVEGESGRSGRKEILEFISKLTTK